MDTLVTTRPDTDTPGLGGPPRTPARAVSWRFITLATVGAFALITAVNVSVRVFHDFYVTVYRSSAHVITPTLIASGRRKRGSTTTTSSLLI